jgi:beta-lactamase superfamily II metal-dependent hydrolase
MYRIGFGDFFLVTVPTQTGPAHILIDCGVHAANIGTMDDCVKDLVKETGGKLALVIATHFHADHLSGFASNYADFAEFEVGAVWITNRLDPGNSEASKFHAQVTSLANQVRLRLGARGDQKDPGTAQALFKMQNALGIQMGAASADGGSNAKALKLLREGFKNKPNVYYYQGGDDPELPDVLKGAITAQLLGPAPKDHAGMFSGTDNKQNQYLAAMAEGGLPETEGFSPFEKAWPAAASDYPAAAFRAYRTEEEIEKRIQGTPAELEAALKAAQPDTVLALADAVDGTLNNQSLVVLFTCQGKKLLFVGDAQWGNWSYWLYGKAVTGKDPGITQNAKDILGSIDFYKVGHHGSTNANPIPAVASISNKCAAMCSTATGAYGNPGKHTEVPRTALMEALEKQIDNKLVRSDWIPAGSVKPDPQAKSELAELPENFSTGSLYVDYIFPTG